MGSGTSLSAVVSSGAVAVASRSSIAWSASRRVAIAWSTRGRSFVCSCGRRDSRMRAPSSSSSSMSCPAACLMVTSWTQVANLSVQASTTNWCRPRSVGSMAPVHRSLLTSAIGAGRHFDSPFGRHRTRPARMSWPSRKMSAETVVGCPITAFAGYRPVVVRGRAPTITIRPVTRKVYHRGADSNPAATALGVDSAKTGNICPFLHCHVRFGILLAIRPALTRTCASRIWSAVPDGLDLLHRKVVDTPSGPKLAESAGCRAEVPRSGPTLSDDNVVRAHPEVLVSDPPVRPGPTLLRMRPGSGPIAPVDEVLASRDDL